MKLNCINYPIFPMRSHYRIYTEDEIVYVDTHIQTWVLDNRNLKGNTLAARRFRIEKPYPLKTTIFTLAQLVQYTTKPNSSRIFIDKYGKMFTYKKTVRVPLTYKKVKDHNVSGTTVAFDVEDINCPIYADYGTLNIYHQNGDELYLGLLWYNKGWLFYEASKKKRKDTWKRI